MNPFNTISDEVLLFKLKGTEHDFVERKPLRQKGDWLQVAISFANSAPIGWPSVLFIGCDDDGNPQLETEKLEDLEKSITNTLERVYPPIYFDIRPVEIGTHACLAVVIPGSPTRPHFAGRAYVRVGPETREASEDQFRRLVDQRSSKVYELQQRIGQKVLLLVQGKFRHNPHQVGGEMILIDCNQFFLTVDDEIQNPTTRRVSYPLERLTLSYDHHRQMMIVDVRDEIFR